ncbi:pilin [Dokdonella sp.]|uniref:pilin n=1 Tax=Dokdonella sp. TaxID=2291710 RepID=UPI001B1FADCC|nr:pilin [Dokdonella sp.]MBO9662829.1 pilin [Dokdonella sp.]
MRTVAAVFASALLAAALVLVAYRFLIGDRQWQQLSGEVSALKDEQQRMRKTLDESHEALAASADEGSLRMREDLQAVAGMRVAIVEYYQTNGKLPAQQADAGLPAPDRYRGKTLKSATVASDGSIDLVFDATSGVDGGRIRLVADTTQADAMGVRWRCETTDYPQIKRVSPLCEYTPKTPKIAGAPAASDGP